MSTNASAALDFSPYRGLHGLRGTGHLLRTVGLPNETMSALAEMSYQATRPFVPDSAARDAGLGLLPTLIDEAIAATVAWRQTQLCPFATR
ncbi:hypothetical protein ACW2Q0_25565 [Nocardia sp. R16R-3T]